MTKKQTLFFDLDGTLTDSAPGIFRSIRYALSELGRPDPGEEILRRFVGPPLSASYPRYCGLSPEDTMRAIRFYQRRYDTEGYTENAFYDGIPDLLDALKAEGRRLAIATSKPAGIAGKVFRHFDLGRWFSALYAPPADSHHFTKTQVLAQALAEETPGDRSLSAMVGDREDDMLAAKAAGIDGVGVLYGYGTKEELLAAGARSLVSSPQALQALLLGPDGR